MLQLPTSSSRAARFTNAQIADMSRGSKSALRVRKALPKADPIIELIDQADAALEKYVLAFNIHERAKEKLPESDRGWAWVSPIGGLIPTLSHGDRFSSERHIRSFFSEERKHSRDTIKDTRANLRKGGQHEQIRREMVQRIESHQRRIVLLTSYEDPQKKAFRAEERRLARSQRTVRLVEKRFAKGEAAAALRKLTDKIATMEPTTKTGAMALLAYIELRCRDDLAEFFADNSFFEAKLHRLIGRTRSFLARNLLS